MVVPPPLRISKMTKIRVRYNAHRDEMVDVEFPYYRYEGSELSDNLGSSQTYERVEERRTLSVTIEKFYNKDSEYKVTMGPTRPLSTSYYSLDYLLGRGEYSCSSEQFEQAFNQAIGDLAMAVSNPKEDK
jgi:hypothetical protein